MAALAVRRIVRRISILLGLLGAVFLVVFSKQVSILTFGTSQHAGAISLLSLVVFFQLVSAGQSALIQGMRRIFDLAKLGVLGALSGTISSIPLVYLFREQGVVLSLVAVALNVPGTFLVVQPDSPRSVPVHIGWPVVGGITSPLEAGLCLYVRRIHDVRHSLRGPNHLASQSGF